MIKIDLITGFLGSGKTSFIKRYAGQLMSQGLNIGILVNDYGAVNVDMMLLQDLEGDLCELEMVAGGCDAHCHKRRFKTKLISMAMYGYDRVIVEPSGVFDVDEFFDVLEEDPIDRFYEIGSVISVIDAGLESDLSEQSEYLLLSQTARAGLAIYSKTQLTLKEKLLETQARVNRILSDHNCPDFASDMILAKDWATLDSSDWDKIMTCGYRRSVHHKLHIEDDGSFKSLYFLNLSPTLVRAREIIKKLFEGEGSMDTEEEVLSDAGQACKKTTFPCGKIFRIKGFLMEDGKWYEVNATKENLTVSPVERGQDVFVVIGEGLDKKAIEKMWEF